MSLSSFALCTMQRVSFRTPKAGIDAKRRRNTQGARKPAKCDAHSEETSDRDIGAVDKTDAVERREDGDEVPVNLAAVESLGNGTEKGSRQLASIKILSDEGGLSPVGAH